MLYYNPETQEICSIAELKNRLRASIPANTEVVQGWYIVYADENPPVPSDGQQVVDGPIIKQNDKYVQTKVLENLLAEQVAEQLAQAKQRKLIDLQNAFEEAERTGTVSSSVGFVIDATERANRDIEGLIVMLEAQGVSSTTFCAADNSFHEVTLENLKTMRLELIAHGQALYAKKWQLRSQIEAAESLSAVEGIEIDFRTV